MAPEQGREGAASRRSPAPRLICGCSATPPAAACWRTRRWPRSASPMASRPRASPSRASLPRTSRSQASGLERAVTEAADSVNSADSRVDRMTSEVQIADDGPVRTIRMNRPDKKNALTAAMYDAMAAAIENAGTDARIRCVLIAGRPGAFTAGNDLTEFMKAAEAGEGLGTSTVRFLHALARSERPLVAAVRASRWAWAPPCCCIATTWSPASTPASRRRSSASASCRRPRRACSHRG